MIEIMSRQEWRDKIPAGLPPGVVANKTGGVTGTRNDAAIVYTPSERRSSWSCTARA